MTKTANAFSEGEAAYTASDHLNDEFTLLDLLLLELVGVKKEGIGEKPIGQYSSVNGEMAEQILKAGVSGKRRESEIRKTAATIFENVKRGAARGLGLPLQKVAGLFGLNRAEYRALVMALAIEADRKYEKIYSVLNDDTACRLPTLGLLKDVLKVELADVDESWKNVFSKTAPLRRFGLLVVGGEEGVSSLGRSFRLAETVAAYFTGPGRAYGYGEKSWQLILPGVADGFKDKRLEMFVKAERIIESSNQTKGGFIFWMHGAKVLTEGGARYISGRLDMPVMLANLEEISAAPDVEGALRNLFRDALLEEAVVVMTNGDEITRGDDRSRRLARAVLSTASEMSKVLFIDARCEWSPDRSMYASRWHVLKLEQQTVRERQEIWRIATKGFGLDDGCIGELAVRYDFTEEEARWAAECAIAASRAGGKGENPSKENIIDVCRAGRLRVSNKYAKKIKARYGWNDIVLPSQRVEQLREICDWVRYKYKVFSDWGFDGKFSYGKGLNVLFTGVSGTGKTMAAEVIARELGLELYKIDLSAMVSKYVGETEKNIEDVFKIGGDILFFDEADALFGKRTDIKDSHDRYANIEVDFLLQKIEEHEGIVILATNLEKNIDEAFKRRMQFVVEFSFPNAEQRSGIWKKAFPSGAPLDDGVDFGFLSERLAVSGGNIKNIALAAAFMAAADGTAIGMKQLMRAVRREYEKTGKLFMPSDFAPYYALLDEARGKDGGLLGN